MRIIGLTGSIACGKSTVSREIIRLGYPVIDGDLLARELTAPGGAALPEIRKVFGNDVFQEDGRLNRRALGRIVFKDPASRTRLDNLLAPYLQNLTLTKIQQAEASGFPLCFLDMPLLFEKGYDRLCDSVWTVWIPEPLQLERLIARDGFTEEEARARMQAVMSSDEKASRSDVVIDNSGTINKTLALVPGLIQQELNQSAVRHSPVRPSPELSFSCEKPMNVPETVSRLPDRNTAMSRPRNAQKKPSQRKVAWRLPSWLMAILITLSLMLVLGFTAQSLMMGYLKKQSDLHIREQAAIDRNYPLEYRDFIETYAEKYNLRPSFVAAVIRNESSFQPDAESRVGARGLMQLMPDTAEWIAGKLKIDSYSFARMYDPESNIQFGCWYLNYLSSLFQGDPVCVISAYHAGQGQVASWLSIREYSPDGVSLDLSSMPDGPTKTYVGRVTRDDAIYQEKFYHTDAADSDNAPDGTSAG